MSEDTEKFVSKLIENTEAETKLLQRLMKDDDTRNMLNLLHKEYYGCLTYLCNFDYAVGENCKQVPIEKIHSRLRDLMEDAFKRITGQDYKTTRQIRKEKDQ